MGKRLVLEPRDELSFIRLVKETSAELGWRWRDDVLTTFSPSQKVKYLRRVRQRRSYKAAKELIENGIDRRTFAIVFNKMYAFGCETKYKIQREWALESFYSAHLDKQLAGLSDAEVGRNLLIEVL